MASRDLLQTILDNLIDLKPDGIFHLDSDYFDYCTGLRMTNEPFRRAVRRARRELRTNADQRHMDLAASIQAVTGGSGAAADALDGRGTGANRNLCLAGGVALNCVANGKVLRDGHFRAHLDSAGGRRRRRRARRSAGRLSSSCRKPRALDESTGMTACRAPISAPPSSNDEIAAAAYGRRARFIDTR